MPLFDEILHKALANDVRRELLLALSEKDKYLSELAEELGKKPQTIDFHLALLSEIGLVSSQWKEGKKFYSLKDRKVIAFIRDKKPLPIGAHPKPPHEIILDAIARLERKIESLESKVDKIKKQ